MILKSSAKSDFEIKCFMMIPMHLSIGAAIGPLLAGALAGGNHWGMIFNMLVISDVFSLLFLSRFGKCKNVRF